MYIYLVANFSNPAALAYALWSFNLEVSINGVIGFIVECYFARRLLRLSGHSLLGWILTVLVCGLSFIHFGLGIFFTDRLFELTMFSRFPQLTWITKIGLGSAAACDMLISISLCCYLYQSRTGCRKTDSLIVTLMLYTLNCGLLTGICAALVIIMFSVYPDSLLFMAFFWVLGKLYCNSCVAMLNSRQALRGKVGLETDNFSKISVPRSYLGSSTTPREPTFDVVYARPKSPRPALTVRVDTTTETLRDRHQDALNGEWVKAEKSSSRSGPYFREDFDGSVSASPESTVPLVPERGRHAWTYQDMPTFNGYAV